MHGVVNNAMKTERLFSSYDPTAFICINSYKVLLEVVISCYIRPTAKTNFYSDKVLLEVVIVTKIQ